MLYRLSLILRLQFLLFYSVNQKFEAGILFFDVFRYCLIKIYRHYFVIWTGLCYISYHHYKKASCIDVFSTEVTYILLNRLYMHLFYKQAPFANIFSEILIDFVVKQTILGYICYHVKRVSVCKTNS